MSNNRIAKPSRSNRKAETATANVNPAITPEMLASAMAIIQAAGMAIPTVAAETPKALPKHEAADFYGGKIWIGNTSGRAWIDGDIDLAELRKAFKFEAAEYKPKSKTKR